MKLEDPSLIQPLQETAVARPSNAGRPPLKSGMARGGKRAGAGRPKSPDRCACGKHTAERARKQRLKCKRA